MDQQLAFVLFDRSVASDMNAVAEAIRARHAGISVQLSEKPGAIDATMTCADGNADERRVGTGATDSLSLITMPLLGDRQIAGFDRGRQEIMTNRPTKTPARARKPKLRNLCKAPYLRPRRRKQRSGGFLRTCAIELMLLIGSTFAQSAVAQENDNFLQFIRDVEFGNAPGVSEQRALKWQYPLHVDLQFAARTAPPIVTSIVKAFSEAGQASGLPTLFFREAFNALVLTADWKANDLEKQVDVISQFFPNKDKARAMQFISFNKQSDRKCSFRAQTNAGGFFQSGLVIVDIGSSDIPTIQHCSVRSIGALYGLAALNISDNQSYPSITNYSLNGSELTDYDKKFLRLLYNPSIRSGMTQQEAMPVFEALVNGKSPK